jgi:hypothetical protein
MIPDIPYYRGEHLYEEYRKKLSTFNAESASVSESCDKVLRLSGLAIEVVEKFNKAVENFNQVTVQLKLKLQSIEEAEFSPSRKRWVLAKDKVVLQN